MGNVMSVTQWLWLLPDSDFVQMTQLPRARSLHFYWFLLLPKAVVSADCHWHISHSRLCDRSVNLFGARMMTCRLPDGASQAESIA
jgi:hypothetical protein